ncbi:MAG: nucleoside triphosphate pyrophosphohydrolase [Myxococcales bacterium]|nr:nucleoside triphosphate pyrophosphohydrolase [Myxococcales bacterium]
MQREPNESSLVWLQRIVAALRSPDGCPWDRKQTHATLKPYLIEEAYEVLDAIDAWVDGDGDDALLEELGDLLFQVVIHAQLAQERHAFDLEGVAARIAQKMVDRHPHVFGGADVESDAEVALQWEALKRREGKGRFDGIPSHLPALIAAQKTGSKAARVGFDWPDIHGVLAKVEEELEEFAVEVELLDRAALQEEFGDLMFAMCNLARHCHIDAEDALRAATRKFQRRFAEMEMLLTESGADVETVDLEEMELAWKRIKASNRAD